MATSPQRAFGNRIRELRAAAGMVYRFIFLFTTEERGLIPTAAQPGDAEATAQARHAAVQLYAEGYAMARLRDMDWSVDNVLLLSIRKASVAGERWSTGESAQPTVHRLVLWSAQLSTAGASNHHTAPPRL